MFDLHQRANLLMRALGDGVSVDELDRNLLMFARQDQYEDAVFPDIGSEDGQAALVTLVKRQRPALVVLDNLSTLATMEDENAAASFDPVLKLIQRIQSIGSAVMIVHHSKKGGRGQNGFRGSSKLDVLLNQTVELTLPKGGPSFDGAAFNMTFHKHRRKRDGSTESRLVRLMDDEDGPRWTTEASEHGKLLALVDAVESCDYASQRALADHFDVSVSTVNTWKAKAITAGMIRADSWKLCVDAAKQREGGAAKAFAAGY